MILPHGWFVDFSGDNLSVCKIQHITSSSSQQLVITHCLSIGSDGVWTTYVYGKQVSHCTLLESFVSTLNPIAASNLLALIQIQQVYPGNLDAKFVAMCQSRNGLIEAADGTVKATEYHTCTPYIHRQHDACIWL